MSSSSKKGSSRGTVLQTEILNSSNKRMELGEKPGPIKTTAEIHRNKKRAKNVTAETAAVQVKKETGKSSK